MPVPAVTGPGSLTLSSGSMSATHDAILDVPPTLNLIFRFGSVITAHKVTSLPVPAVVGTAIIGGVGVFIGAGAPPVFRVLASWGAATPVPLARSVEAPPPVPARPSPPRLL